MNFQDFLDVATIEEMLARQEKATLREQLMRLEGADIAELAAQLPKELLVIVYRILPKELAAEAFAEMDTDLQESLIASFTDSELQSVLAELYYDDTVDIIEEMPASVVKRILRNATPDDRRMINELLRYDPDSAGGLMTTEYMLLKAEMTVGEAYQVIRKNAYDKESVYTCYVTDASRHLIGVVDIKTLLLASLDTKIKDCMNPDVVFVYTTDESGEVARQFEKYNFIAIPVVDKEERLVGIVTFDDAMDVIREETEEDFAKMAAVAPSDTPYLRTSSLKLWKNRFPWLFLMMMTSTFTGMIISSFEAALAASVALTAFIPMLMGTGGNSGAQASVTVIRGLSLGEVAPKDILRILLKELTVSLLCGVTLAIATFAKMMTLDRWIMGGDAITFTVALVVSLALLVTVISAKLIGGMLPVLAVKCKLDPAVMASPFITTVVDALSLLVYFAVAQSILGI